VSGGDGGPKQSRRPGGRRSAAGRRTTAGETRFKLTLEYDGSAFGGWQVQPGGPTVQGELERIVRRLTGERRVVAGAGRTDSGVHATGQVAAVTMPERWTAAELARSLNATLPPTIWVRAAEAVALGFDPRRQATARNYEYRVGLAPRAASPFRRRWCWPLCRPFDLEAAASAARHLNGTRNFRAFAKSGQPQRGTACRVLAARWARWETREGPEQRDATDEGALGVVFRISANRFLHRMVRYLVGTMVDVARGRRDAEELGILLGDKPSSLRTSRPAPPQGLFLTDVRYDTETEEP